MLSRVTLNELQAERDALLSDLAQVEKQLEWVSLRVDSIETVLALYSPEHMARPVKVPRLPTKVETVIVGMAGRVRKAIDRTRGQSFTVQNLVDLMYLRADEKRDRSALAARVFLELVKMAERGKLERDGKSFHSTSPVGPDSAGKPVG